MTHQEALSEVLEHVDPLEAVDAPLIECAGQVIAEDVRSEHDLPMLDMCGPDGYAVRSEDIRGAGPGSPVTLHILGTNRAGCLPRRRLRPGAAIRVMTGSPLPAGADCVVPFEKTDEPADKNGPNPNLPTQVRVFKAEEPGANVRPAGSNVTRGSLVLPRGVCVGPAQISALGAIGRATIKVIRRPTAAIVSTGDELTSLGTTLKPGKSYDSNAAAIATLVAHYGAIPRVLGIARDSEASLAAKIGRALTADAIITSGGVSKGDYDLVRSVLGKMGRVVFSRIDMGPGASFAFGLVRRDQAGEGDPTVPFFALSGPPVGCLINFETLVRPALLKMMGCHVLSHPVVEAVAEDSSWAKKPMTFVKWTRLSASRGTPRVVLNTSDGLGPLAAMAAANSLTIIPQGTVVKQGDRVQVLPLDWTKDSR